MQIGNLIFTLPALITGIGAIFVLILGVIAANKKSGVGRWLDHWLSPQHLAPCVTAAAAFAAAWLLCQQIIAMLAGKNILNDVSLFVVHGHAQLTADPFSVVFTFIALAGTVVVMILSLDHFGEEQCHKAEYYSLLMFAATAASLAAAASDLIAIYLSIEFLSLISYVLAAYSKTDRRSAEAGLKYFLYGAACSAVMLYGMSLLFGLAGGSTELSAIAVNMTHAAASSAVGWVAIMFVLVGMGFKLALVPFHFWAPDAYEGSPTPVTAFLSVVSKAAGLAVVIRFLTVVASHGAPAAQTWYWMLVVLTAITMFYGNMVAIWQRNIKRMLAYSSIAQVGYLMIGVLTALHSFAAPAARELPAGGAVQASFAGSAPWDLPGVMFYALAYLLMNLGAFAVVVAMGKRLGSDAIEDYAGLGQRAAVPAGALALFLVSLAGVPPTAGFIGKWVIFGGAVSRGLAGHPELTVLAILGVVNSVISAYYYLNVVRLMWFAPGASKIEPRPSISMGATIVVMLVLTIAVLIFAQPIFNVVSKAVYVSASALH